MILSDEINTSMAKYPHLYGTTATFTLNREDNVRTFYDHSMQEQISELCWPLESTGDGFPRKHYRFFGAFKKPRSQHFVHLETSWDLHLALRGLTQKFRGQLSLQAPIINIKVTKLLLCFSPTLVSIAEKRGQLISFKEQIRYTFKAEIWLCLSNLAPVLYETYYSR